MINWLNKSEGEWTRVLRQVETEVQLSEKQLGEAEKKRSKKNKETDDSSDDERTVKARKKARAQSKAYGKKSKPSGAGVAKFCAYCKKLGHSEKAYTSHNEEDCTVKHNSYKSNKDYQKGFSGDRKAKAHAQDHYEKTLKKQSRQIKEMRKVLKTMHRSAGGREARAASARVDQETISSFLNNDSASDVSMSDSK